MGWGWGGAGGFSALHPLIFFTSLMHFPSVTRTPKSEDSDSARYRLRKEMKNSTLRLNRTFLETPARHTDGQCNLPGLGGCQHSLQ